MAGNSVVINDLISFDIGDVELEKLLSFLYSQAELRMNCRNCGMTIIPQCRSHHSNTGETEFKVVCIGCGKSSTVRMYGKYGFIIPTDDEFYKGIRADDGWEK
jgi:ribosomal protein S27E